MICLKLLKIPATYPTDPKLSWPTSILGPYRFNLLGASFLGLYSLECIIRIAISLYDTLANVSCDFYTIEITFRLDEYLIDLLQRQGHCFRARKQIDRNCDRGIASGKGDKVPVPSRVSADRSESAVTKAY